MKRLTWLTLLLLLLISGCAVRQGPCTHKDSDKNGICDSCQESVMTTFDVYSINDLHGKIADGADHPGVDELTTYLEQARQTDDNVILLSAGDMWQGSWESNLTDGILTTDWMNEAGFTAMTLGNHEFDWGEEKIEKNAEFAQFPLLAINIYDRNTDEPVDYCQPSVVVEFDGIQVGIIGAIGDCYSSIAPEKVADVYFKTGQQLTVLVKEESQRLRASGVDFIIYCMHDGYGESTPAGDFISRGALAPYYDASLSDGYVDLVFEGHTHQQYALRDIYGVYHLQNRGDNRGGISHVEVLINTVTGEFSIEVRELVKHYVYSGLEDDPIVDELLEKYAEEITQGTQVLGNNREWQNSDELGQLVAELYYRLGREVWGREYDVVLGGGLVSVRSPYHLEPGQVTYGQLQTLLPFDNDILLCSIRGSDLLERFIHNDHSKYFTCYDEGLEARIERNAVYYIVVDTYTASYAPNRLRVVERYEPGIYARDLLAEHIQSGGLD